MPGHRPTILVLATLLGGLLVINSVAIFIILRQRTENAALRAQLAARQSELQPRRARTLVAPPADPDAFTGVAESAIPGRYQWTKSGEAKGVVTLNADHSFANEKGEKFRVYRWELAADALTLTWQRGPVRFTVVEAPGVYVALRPDGETERLQKLE